MDLYIYYRVRHAEAAAAQSAVAGMHAALAAQHGVNTALKRRPEEEQGGLQTWMEIYSAVPDGFEAALALAVEQAELSRWIEGTRHVERFVDVTPCA